MLDAYPKGYKVIVAMQVDPVPFDIVVEKFEFEPTVERVIPPEGGRGKF